MSGRTKPGDHGMNLLSAVREQGGVAGLVLAIIVAAFMFGQEVAAQQSETQRLASEVAKHDRELAENRKLHTSMLLELRGIKAVLARGGK